MRRVRCQAKKYCVVRGRASFDGTVQAFEASLANEPPLILAALVTVCVSSTGGSRAFCPSPPAAGRDVF